MNQVPALEQGYEFKAGRLVFEDGTEYNLGEALLLAKDKGLTDTDIQAIHLVKKAFDGNIVSANINGKEVSADKVNLPVKQEPEEKVIVEGEKDELDTLTDSFGDLPYYEKDESGEG